MNAPGLGGLPEDEIELLAERLADERRERERRSWVKAMALRTGS